uniref:28 kDa Metastriate family member n=1 Tax=Rhipicephalus zambeziensis TaxID=60191 RepID=A0A224YBN9_9ACAR
MPRFNVLLLCLCLLVPCCIADENTTQDSKKIPPLVWSPRRRRQNLRRENFYCANFKTQRHFNNRSVMISIAVHNISWNTSLEVKKGGVLNGTATLKNLQNYSEVFHLSNDSIVYLFTNKTPMDDSYMGAAIPGVFSSMSTFGTFCTGNRSAAIVVLDPERRSYWGTVKATAEIFGSKTFHQFKQEDFMKMNETFSRCHVTETQSAESEED